LAVVEGLGERDGLVGLSVECPDILPEGHLGERVECKAEEEVLEVELCGNTSTSTG
jgi:hypothetical protein